MNVRVQKVNLASVHLSFFDESAFDVVWCDPPFGIGDRSATYRRKRRFVVEGYQETGNLMEFYEKLMRIARRVLKPGGLAYFLSGTTCYGEMIRAASACFAPKEILNHPCHPYTFGVYAPTRFVVSHYNALLLCKEKGRLARHDSSRNQGKPYTLDVIPMQREYQPERWKYVNQLPVGFCRKMAWHLVPDGGKVLDLCCGSGSFALGLMQTISDFEYLGVDINDAGLLLARKRIMEQFSALGGRKGANAPFGADSSDKEKGAQNVSMQRNADEQGRVRGGEEIRGNKAQ